MSAWTSRTSSGSCAAAAEQQNRDGIGQEDPRQHGGSDRGRRRALRGREHRSRAEEQLAANPREVEGLRVGHAGEFTWEPRRHVPQRLLDEYVVDQTRAAKKRERDAVSHTVRVAGRAPKEMRNQRRNDAKYIEEEIARAAVDVMRSARTKTKKSRASSTCTASPRRLSSGCTSGCATPPPSMRLMPRSRWR